jgi:hypothetical protein
MTIALYQSVEGPMLFRLRDQGEGVICNVIAFQGRWVKIELPTHEVGYVNLDEGYSTGMPLHFCPGSTDER